MQAVLMTGPLSIIMMAAWVEWIESMRTHARLRGCNCFFGPRLVKWARLQAFSALYDAHLASNASAAAHELAVSELMQLLDGDGWNF